MHSTPPVVCDLSALSDPQRLRVAALTDRLFPSADEARELPDGYALGFADTSDDLIAELAEFIALDRRCCPFLRHSLVSEPAPGMTWLELTGGTGAKEAITADVEGRVRRPATAVEGVASSGSG